MKLKVGRFVDYPGGRSYDLRWDDPTPFDGPEFDRFMRDPCGYHKCPACAAKTEADLAVTSAR